jgi:hypothetical protein
MTISNLKNELSDLLSQKRGEAITSSKGRSLKLTPIVVGSGAAVLVAGAVMLMPKGGTPQPVAVNPQDTAQQEMALQFMARQQAINEKLLIGQQELSAQMIEAQSKAKPVQPNITCLLAICPGTGKSETPSSDFAVVGEGIQTARVDPARVLPQLQQQVPQQAHPSQPVQPQQPPVPIENYSGVQQVSTVRPDAAERAYRALSRELVERPETFYNVAWAWREYLHSDNPTAQALRRIFKEFPNAAPYTY